MKSVQVIALTVAAVILVGSDARSSSPQRRTASTAESQIVRQGREAFERNCAACHAKGPSEGRVPLLPGTYALSLKYKGQLPAALEDRRDLTPEFIEAVVRNGVFSMPPLRKTEVSDQELRAIAAYFRESSKHPRGPITTGPNKVAGPKVN